MICPGVLWNLNLFEPVSTAVSKLFQLHCIFRKIFESFLDQHGGKLDQMFLIFFFEP